MYTDLLSATDQMIVVAHNLAPSRPLEAFGKTVMDAGYRAVWFLFKDQPFDVGRISRPDGTWMGYYADILEPVRWKDADAATLEPIVDLFLDLWIAPDGRFLILDEDEFENAIGKGILTVPQVDHARSVLRDLIRKTERRDFPPSVVKAFRS